MNAKNSSMSVSSAYTQLLKETYRLWKPNGLVALEEKHGEGTEKIWKSVSNSFYIALENSTGEWE